MSEPTVCAIMLTRDRPELARKAVECFRAQTYENKVLLIWNSGKEPSEYYGSETNEQITEIWGASNDGDSIGRLRNDAVSFWNAFPIMIHWDDDDWSHPNRIAEQVALLQASGAEVVGYNEMLFWREPRRPSLEGECAQIHFGDAWLYSNSKPPAYALGTSLCYWRKTWEAHHFADETQGVEDHWLRETNLVSVSSIGEPYRGKVGTAYLGDEPRMIARIHAGNTSNGYKLEEYVALGTTNWKRVSEWNERVRGILA